MASAGNRAIRLTGDWDIASITIRKMTALAKKAVLTTNKQLGLYAEGQAKKHIRNQDLGWPDNAPSTKAAKMRKGESDKVLIATSTMFQTITSYTEGEVTYAGIKRDVKYGDGDNVHNIARRLEYGGGNTPPRPLWAPVLKEVKEKAQSGLLRQNLAKVINKFKANTGQ